MLRVLIAQIFAEPANERTRLLPALEAARSDIASAKQELQSVVRELSQEGIPAHRRRLLDLSDFQGKRAAEEKVEAAQQKFMKLQRRLEELRLRIEIDEQLAQDASDRSWLEDRED